MYTEKKELYIPYYNESLNELYKLFNCANYELYLVGGCVRDVLLNHIPKDIDLCTNATPKQVKKIIRGTKFESWDSGLKHGTLTITSIDGDSFEVTTYRDESKANYEDHRHNSNVTYSLTLEEDLKRRDFTINSFAYNYLSKELLMLDESYLDDLKLGVIRCVGNPDERFNEDALRMLRAIRFSAQLGFTIETETYDSIIKNADLMKYISKERIRDELTKILLSDHPEMIEVLRVTGIDDWCCLNLDRLLIPQHNKYHYTDILHHTYDVLKRTPVDFETRWAALFHDMGKPDTISTDEEGYMHFYGHPDISAKRAEVIMDALKFTNKQKENILKLVKYHDYDVKEMKLPGFKRLINEVGIDLFPKFIDLRLADAYAHQLYTDVHMYIHSISKLKTYYMKILKTKDCMTLKDLAINGHDIVEDGFLRDEEIGQCLRWMLNRVIEHPEYNTREKLLELLELFKEMSFQSS